MIYTGNIVQTFIKLIKCLLFSPWGALWYLYASMVAVLILSRFYKRGKFHFPIIIGSFLYIFALLCNSYYFLVENCFIGKIVNIYMKIFLTARNGIFVGILYMSIGVLISKLYFENKLVNKSKCIFCLIFFYLFLLFEVSFIRNKNFIDDSSLFISLPFISFFLVSLLLLISNDKKYEKCRKYSTILYLIHRFVMAIIIDLFNINYGIKLFIIVISICLLICIIFDKNARLKNDFVEKVLLL